MIKIITDNNKINLPKLFCFLISLLLAGCGGGGGGDSGSSSGSTAPQTPIVSLPQTNVANTVDITVTHSGFNQINTPYISLTLCSPSNPGNCQTIDHILVDTGSVGLRVFATALNSSLVLNPMTVGGNPVAECMQFAQGYMWGGIQRANLQIAGLSANNLAIQVIGAAGLTNSVPSTCRALGTNLATAQSYYANGVLGVGLFNGDCGSSCTQSGNNVYYTCTSSSCSSVPLALTDQVLHPATQFSSNSNGVIISLDPIKNTATGDFTGSGKLIFGVDTQANNASQSTAVLTTTSSGYISTTFNGRNYAHSYIDTGSNGIFFNFPGTLLCPSGGFYCPNATMLSQSATLTGTNGVGSTIQFDIANVNTLINSNPSFAAFNNVAGDSADGAVFDWGLPFFYGKNVSFVIEGNSTTKGTGPYYAWW